MSESTYNALTGEEIRVRIMAEVARDIPARIKRQLADDHNFKKALTYHKVSWQWKLNVQAFSRNPFEVTVQGEANAQSLEEEILRLQREKDQRDQEWKGIIERERKLWAEKEADMTLQIRGLQAQLDRMPEYEAELSRLRDSATITSAEKETMIAAESPVEDDAFSFSFERKQSPIEEPDRIREDNSDLSDVVVGRPPAEAHTIDTDGKPVTVNTGRGAVVGGGKRPSSVVGRQR